VDVDCDRDTLLFTVRQSGQGFCHRASYNCFGEGERGTPLIVFFAHIT
jgi:phosphoribosyl-AMP cyclohydrolase